MTRFAWEGGEVSGDWHEPSTGRDYLILAHGAGGTMQTPSMAAYAEAIADRGLGAVRFNFAYSEAGRKAPDRTEKLEAVYRAVLDEVASKAERVFLGGRSMGGRIGSHLAAQGARVAGLVFLSYPLHPPGKPERMRDEHLYEIDAPMLFIQGTRDPFGSPDEFEPVVRKAGATLHLIEGGDHSHRVKGRPAADVIEELANVTLDWLPKG